MTAEIQRFEFQWRGLLIEVRYCPDWMEGYREAYGYPLAHLDVESMLPSKAPLPITETGYRSHFDRPENIEVHGGPVTFVLEWLDHEAESSKWTKQQTEQRQLSLF